jgi:hypothetical protein
MKEHYKGKLEKIEIEENIENTCKNILSEKGFDFLIEYYKSCKEQLLDLFLNQYIIIENELYKTNIEQHFCSNDIFTSEENEDGTINFEIEYNYGNFSFVEAVKKAINKTGE